MEVGNPESHEKARENHQGTVLIVCSYFRIVKIEIITDNNENHELGICTFVFYDEKMKFGGHFCIQNVFLNFLVNNKLIMSV